MTRKITWPEAFIGAAALATLAWGLEHDGLSTLSVVCVIVMVWGVLIVMVWGVSR